MTIVHARHSSCHEVRTYLRPKFPEVLCPEDCYPEIV